MAWQEVGERELGETEDVRLRCCTEMATWLAVEVSINSLAKLFCP